MIKDDSFFKNIPAALDLKQRLTWEAAGWAIQMISLSFDRLRSAASRIDAASSTYPTSLAPEIFASCWSMIDQCHMLRQILASTSPRPGGVTQNFIDKFEAVTLIRNVMDHLHTNIDNLANSKKPMPPVFGALSFCAIANEDLIIEANVAEPTARECRIVTLTAGALTHPQTRFRAANPLGRLLELPVGLFQFEAFKNVVDFSDLIASLKALVHHFDTVVKPDQEIQLRDFARQNNLDEEKILTESNVSLMTVVVIGFETEADGKGAFGKSK
jgi:hypothetical protein